MRINVVVKVLVVNQAGEVLALRRSETDTRRPGHWDLPGGWLDGGEDPRETAKRECIEEAGIAVTGLGLVHATSDMTAHGPCVWLAFRAEMEGQQEVRLGEEHDAYAWMSPDALLNELVYEHHRALLSFVIQHNLLAV